MITTREYPNAKNDYLRFQVGTMVEKWITEKSGGKRYVGDQFHLLGYGKSMTEANRMAEKKAQFR